MKLISIVIPILKKENETFVWGQTRDSNDELSGLWEFPGGKVEQTETIEEAAVREVAEEVGVKLEIKDLELFGRYVFEPLSLNVFLVKASCGQFLEDGFKKLADLNNELESLPPNNKSIIKDLIKRFQ